ncbi:GNAT family N-acetyltransferase [Ruminiclostridium herbifermentans]|uniref:GNAT family N-acetyltransferase n=1 Tax=Ruminiclostridium herbifermentans TaxID=2488810 RepID=A0A4U7JFR5_9FIRM|nr:GNAT family N-acetyltransferase [Ruminiclostridium herbifermentans]QNU65831.1 GNAT family N-acetyltransferase [Ruminiclostridium herbifermentans]
MEIIKLTTEMINKDLFAHFMRHQKVSKCWRKIDGKWCIIDISLSEDWGEAEYNILVACLKNTVTKGGVVFGVFVNDMLKGFSSVEPFLFGQNKEYLDLSSIHVSEDMRGKGIGKELFRLSKDWAKQNGAKKLYISAHSSVETQDFYRAMGCVEALEYNKEHVENEPCDCQLECVL